MKPIFAVTYTFDGKRYCTVLSGPNKAKSIRSFKRQHPNVRNVKSA